MTQVRIPYNLCTLTVSSHDDVTPGASPNEISDILRQVLDTGNFTSVILGCYVMQERRDMPQRWIDNRNGWIIHLHRSRPRHFLHNSTFDVPDRLTVPVSICLSLTRSSYPEEFQWRTGRRLRQ
jgi:hypothetical protein